MSLIGFDGFVVNRQGEAKDLLLLREFTAAGRWVEPTVTEWVDLHQAAFPGEFPAQLAFARQNHFDLHVVLVPRDYPQVEDHGSSIYFLECVQGLVALQRYDKDSFPDKLAELRGHARHGRPKGLISARTRLECHLANETSNAWPGNIDHILLKDGRPVAILEYKTHNKRDDLRLESLDRHGEADWNRFKALYSLQERLGGVPILFLVWGPGHPIVKIDKIVGAKNVEAALICPRMPEDLLQGILSLL
jgi:hypothetical protein